MLLLFYLATVFAIQLSTAQILTLAGANNQIGIPLQNVNNIQRTLNVPSNVVVNNGISGISVNSLPLNSLPVSNVQIARNQPVTGGIVNGFSNGNLLTVPSNNLGISNFGSNLATGAVNLANNLGTNFVNRNVGANFVNANTPINLANGFNINTGTFAVGNTGLASLLPNGRPCGIQIAADALEVGGTVGVNGYLPLYATVNVNGQLPTSGTGYASCGCGGQ